MDRRYHDGDYLQHNPTWHAEFSPWKADQILRAIERNGLAPRSVCEVGSGAGEILARLHDRLPNDVELVGYDIAPDAHALAVERERPRLSFRLADFLEEDTPRFDLVLIVDVIEHVPDYLGFVRRLKGRADHIIFKVPMEFSVYSALRQGSLLASRRSVGHLHYFNRTSALATIRDSGFEVLDDFLVARYESDAGPPTRSPLTKGFRVLRRQSWKMNPDLTAKLVGNTGLMVVAR